MQKISIKKVVDQTSDENACILDRTKKQISVETTGEEYSNISLLIESDTYSPTNKGNILNLNLVDTT